ncbi:MAG TPA: hypothetical protein VM901_08770 [Bdellovibrionota bacterium]|nr:hypothetical protein [Bdellovibrionota bacterium]
MFRSILLALALAFGSQTFAGDAHKSCDELLLDVEVGELVLQNLLRIREYPGNYAAAAQSIMVQLMDHVGNPNLDFHYFERFIRKNNLRLFLVASSERIPANYSIDFTREAQRLARGPAKYYLWIGVNGSAETAEYLRFLGITAEENLERLKDTGVLMVDRLEDLHRDSTALDQDTVEQLKQHDLKLPRQPPDK